uniref:EOG090X0JX7 n=1 Tax=Lynceus sp. MCZ IZ 141354 TaxID=1930659 RepID=A0A9N6WWE2_9CRUS|nr:EOG090X0JX7 [Lynceus sp. MCZ IZ 141354]
MTSFCRLLFTRTSLRFPRLFFQNRLLTTVRTNNQQSPQIPKNTTKYPWEVETNLQHDVILFRYENPKLMRVLNYFAISQFLFWIYLVEFTHSITKDAPVETAKKDISWFKKLALFQNKYKNGIMFLFTAIGTGILLSSWLYSLRVIRLLVLRKGGQTVTFVTYAPFARKRYMDVPLREVSAKLSRAEAKSHLPIKVKGTYGHFSLDSKGEFTNSKLFDATVGLRRF